MDGYIDWEDLRGMKWEENVNIIQCGKEMSILKINKQQIWKLICNILISNASVKEFYHCSSIFHNSLSTRSLWYG